MLRTSPEYGGWAVFLGTKTGAPRGSSPLAVGAKARVLGYSEVVGMGLGYPLLYEFQGYYLRSR